jgi:hypothetical protein
VTTITQAQADQLDQLIAEKRNQGVEATRMVGESQNYAASYAQQAIDYGKVADTMQESRDNATIVG